MPGICPGSFEEKKLSLHLGRVVLLATVPAEMKEYVCRRGHLFTIKIQQQTCFAVS